MCSTMHPFSLSSAEQRPHIVDQLDTSYGLPHIFQNGTHGPQPTTTYEFIVLIGSFSAAFTQLSLRNLCISATWFSTTFCKTLFPRSSILNLRHMQLDPLQGDIPEVPHPQQHILHDARQVAFLSFHISRLILRIGQLAGICKLRHLHDGWQDETREFRHW